VSETCVDKTKGPGSHGSEENRENRSSGPLADANDPLVLRIPDALIRGKRSVPIDALV
jgi:hypothetical protein